MDGKNQLQSLFMAFFLVAIAVGFHYSAIIYFAVIPLLYLKLDRKIYLSLFAFFAVLVPTLLQLLVSCSKGQSMGTIYPATIRILAKHFRYRLYCL